MFRSSFTVFILSFCSTGLLIAADGNYEKEGNVPPKITKLTPEHEAAILKDVKVADGFEVTLFANSAAANYPVFVAAAPDGTLYVSSDGNGSLGRNPKRGRIIRLRDLNGDGRADETKVFCEVDSPRGLVWDHDRLYLVHPPHISEFIDTDHDGVAEKQNILVKDIAFGFKDRPADHTTNGLSIGIDGWLYIAGGDFGFMKATGTDGRTLQHRGGGVIRLRPDGSGLEIYSTGTRNILEVAISPLMDMFARDNTNDGGGWNVRFHHFTGLDDHGYPRLYKNFNDECIQPLADYGGGSGCGAVYIDEPGFGDWNNAPFTCDWGSGALWHHEVKPKGATFEETRKPEPFIKMTCPTDADVDGMSRVYCASWKGATFGWAGPDVGYIVQVKPKGFKPEPLPDFTKAKDEELVKVLESASNRRRMEAQRELVRRNTLVTSSSPTVIDSASIEVAKNTAALSSARAAAIFTLAQSAGALKQMVSLPSDTETDKFIFRGLYWVVINPKTPSDLIDELWVSALSAGRKEEADKLSPRSQLSKMHVLSTGKVPWEAMIKHLTSADPVIKHAAMAMYRKAPSVALTAGFGLPEVEGAAVERYLNGFRMLSGVHTTDVVTSLISRLGKATDPALRQGILAALCRLHFKEGEWKGDSWGTRPDTRGPYYQPEAWSETPKIAVALKDALAKASPEEAAFLVKELNRNRIQFDEAQQRILALAKQDPKMLPDLAAQLAGAEEIPAEAVPLLVGIVQRSGSGLQPAKTLPTADGLKPETTSPAMLSQTIIALSKTDSAEGVSATLAALDPLKKLPESSKDFEAAFNAFLNAAKLENHHQLVEQIAEKAEWPVSMYADAALLNLAARKTGSPESIHLSQKALDTGWADAKRRKQILDAIGLIKHQPSAPRVLAALDDPDPAVKRAAESAAKAMRLSREKDDTPLLATMKLEDILAAVMKTRGNVGRGEELFTKQTCVACHTTKESEPQKGPYLGNIAQTYKRVELAEAILNPNKTIAQGFQSNLFTLKDGTQQMGFVTLESADKVTIRNIAAQELTYAVKDIAKRERIEPSLMPPGLVLNITLRDFASLLDYLETLAKNK